MNPFKYTLVSGLVVITMALASTPAAAVTRDNFVVHTTNDLLVLCTAQESEPLYQAAIGFCHGYFVGAYHYHQAVTPPDKKRFVCPPEPKPSRAEIIEKFAPWARAHPEHGDELPVETIFRFLVDTWPCPKESR